MATPNIPDGVRLTDEFTKEDFRSTLGIFQTEPVEVGSSLSGSLVAAATVVNNNTRVQCLADQNSAEIVVASDWASLTVFGIPDTPTNLTTNLSVPLSFKVSWTAPFSLPGEVVTYDVNVTNVNTTAQFLSESLTETTYIFATLLPYCEFYEFSIVAVNEAGKSDRARLVNIPMPTCMFRFQNG